MITSLRFACAALLLPVASATAQHSAVDRANADAATTDYARTGRAKVVSSGGDRALVPFGHGQPVLSCAPLRVCTVELQSGERILDHVLGDPERWAIEFAVGPKETPLIVAKPVGIPDACDLTTNLMVTTSVRIYHLTLDSPPCARTGAATNPLQPYIRQMAFYYPDEALDRPRASGGGAGVRSAPSASLAGSQPPGAAPSMAIGDLAQLHFAYRATPDRRFPWRPLHVFDNGRQTCVRLPDEAWNGDLPVLYELDERGEYGMVNYVVRDGCMLADRVMTRMVLLLAGGNGGTPIRLLVVRQVPRER